ncbi:hypothetical protein N1851_015454 [Merluccius polli]|uniref:Uncharacterized protein n=1 Tax=Merluccius polli TaxID=89951 RepID=A0AA47MSU4_MERPO|nr:hypothetical protein N1851_015454 [Merluccius polli]
MAEVVYNVAVNLLESSKSHLLSYRNNGFAAAQASAKDACEEMHVETLLKEKRRRLTLRWDALNRLETTFFDVVVEHAILHLWTIALKHLSKLKASFGYCQTSQLWMKKHWRNNNTLRNGVEADIDGRELAMEIRNLPQLRTNRMTA